MTSPAANSMTDRQAILRDYAAGRISWSAVRARGIDSYVDVLAGLGALGLRPPMTELGGPNAASRAAGRAMIRELLAKRAA